MKRIGQVFLLLGWLGAALAGLVHVVGHAAWYEVLALSVAVLRFVAEWTLDLVGGARS